MPTSPKALTQVKANPDTDAADCLGTETILPVEEDRAVREVARRSLGVRGYRVLAASSASEARDVFTASGGRIDLPLTDVVMPGAGGPELREELTKRCPNLEVLYISGDAGHAIVRHGIVDEGLPFRQKPFES